MKNYKAKSGSLDEKVWYKSSDMEKICLNALSSVDLLPIKPCPIRIDRFVKKKFGIDHEYEDLPDGLLGCTMFGKKGVERIIVAKALELDKTIQAERRIFTTLAHEAGHGLFHSSLFYNRGESLFADHEEKPRIMCREELKNVFLGKRGSYDGNWYEYQANRAIGALLLPKPLAEEALESFTVPSGLFLRTLDESKFEEAVLCLSQIFNVNPAVAKIRVRDIFPIENSRQLSL